jgi:predicted hydrocarbon binding protein
MKENGILKGGKRKEPIWKKTVLGEPFKMALDRFRDEVLGRDDFDPTSLLQYGLFMSMAVLNILKENEKKFGIEGQKVVNDALVKTGYEVGKQMIEGEDIHIPQEIKPIELMSFLATIINTQAWTSIEDPKIDNNEKCSFDILWCPLQDVYNAFDCRVQRYLVQGIIDAFRDSGKLEDDFQVYFTQTIPAGAECCSFVIEKKRPGDVDRWESYSKLLERKAMERMKKNEKDN